MLHNSTQGMHWHLNEKSGQRAGRHGFTLVELLIVIVVIAILAAITVIAYNGVQQKAQAASAEAAVSQASRALVAYQAIQGGFPDQLSDANIHDTNGTSYQYSFDNTVTPPIFCVTATSKTTSYYIDNDTHTTPTLGGCPGDGVGGVPPITNLVINPNVETALTGWNAQGVATLTKTTTQAYSGTASVQVVTSGSAGDQGVKTGDSSVTVGTTYLYSVWVKGTSGMPLHITLDEYNNSTYVAQTVVSFTTNGSWQHESAVRTVATGNILRGGVRTASAIAATYYVDAAMLTQGTNLYNFADGSSPGWKWNGAADNSTSTGPSL